MQFIDLNAQQRLIRDKIESNIRKVLDHGKYIMGPEVKELEERLADFVGVKYAIGCSSGTDALLMVLMSYGVGYGDYIITTPFTFIATAEVITLLGAKPIFADIDEKTYNIDPEKIENFLKNPADPLTNKAIEPDRIKGIIPVDIFGLPADYDKINDIAKKYNMFVIEDAAQSFGAEYKGKKACSLADIGCTSFFPAKPLGCYGDGGMIFTDNDDIVNILKSIRVHGQGSNKYDNIRIGINGRLDTIQAAILLVKFEIFNDEINKRQIIGNSYNKLLNKKYKLQQVPNNYKSVWAQYCLRSKNNINRNDIIEKLKNENIPTAIYYPKPLHLQLAFENLGYKLDDFPVSEKCSEEIFNIPIHPYLKEDEQKKIIENLSFKKN